MKLLVPLLVVCALLPGCSSLTTHRDAAFGEVRRIYVEHHLTDNHHLDDLIVGELQARGYAATSGPLTMLPEGVDAVITYQDRWAWDFKSYLIELNLEMHTTFTGKTLATGHYHQASAFTKDPADVVAEIIAPLFPRH
jgi:hypothetical protein